MVTSSACGNSCLVNAFSLGLFTNITRDVQVIAIGKPVPLSRRRSSTPRVLKHFHSTSNVDKQLFTLRKSKIAPPFPRNQGAQKLPPTKASPIPSSLRIGYGLRGSHLRSSIVEEPFTTIATNNEVEGLRRVSFRELQKEGGWQLQKEALKKKFQHTGWLPRKRLSPAALEGIRAIHAQYPDTYTTPVLAEKFKVSPEAVRRILKSKWRPNESEERERQRRWDSRGEKIWSQMVEMGLHPPKRWRELGIESPDGWRKHGSEG